jgi:hypothetical protein
MRVTIGLLASILLLAAGPRLPAQTVEVLAGQNGGGELSESTESIVSGCLDLLFQSGIIATNDRPQELDPQAFADPGRGMDSAAAGYVDILLSFRVSYGPSTAMAGRSVPLALDWRVLRVSDRKVLGTGSLAPALDSPMDQKKFDAALRTLGSDLGKACLPILRTRIGLALPQPMSALASSAPFNESSGQGVKP